MKKRVLLVTEHDPRSINYGAGQRTHNLWKALRETSEVDVAWFAGVSDELSIQNIEDTGIKRILLPAKTISDRWWNLLPSRRCREVLDSILSDKDYDVVVSRYITPFFKLNLWELNCKIVVDFDDPIYRDGFSLLLPFREQIKRVLKIINQKWIASKLSEMDLAHVHFLFVSNRDASNFSRLVSSILPNIPLVEFKGSQEPVKLADQKSILFVGLMSYPPNRQGVDHFLKYIWPNILEKEPLAIFRIAGKVSDELRKKWSTHHNCEVLGYVEDLSLAYQSATIAVSPIYSGGGTNIKVPEAYAYGCPMVVSEFSYFGWQEYFLEDKDILVGKSDMDFARKCLVLLNSEEARIAFAVSGSKKVQADLSFDFYCRSAIEWVRE